MRNFCLYIIFLSLIFGCLTGFAQNYSLNYLTTEQGLSQNEVTSIIQDKYGFMWFGTRGGLNRYDGYEFIHHKPKADTKNLISNPSIETIFEDSKGNLWIGTKSGGLNHYDTKTERFSHIISFGTPSLPIQGIRVICIAEAKNGNILMGTWSNGMYVLDFNQEKLVHLFKGMQVNKILVENDNSVWVATNSALFQLNLVRNTSETINLDHDGTNVTELILDEPRHTLWLVGWGLGIIAYNTKDKSHTNYRLEERGNPSSKNPNDTYSILKDKKDQLWIGTWNSGLFKFNIKSEKFNKVELQSVRSRPYSNDYDIILDIFEDNNETIWVGTDAGGIVKLGSQKSFNSVSEENNPDCGLNNFHMNCFWKSDQGVLYVGTRGGGLYRTSDNKTFEFIDIEKSIEHASTVKTICPITDSTIWVSFDNQCYQLNIKKDGGILRLLDDTNINQLQKITAILKTDSSLLIGTQQNGLRYFPNIENTNDFNHYTLQNSRVLQTDRITFIKEDSHKKIWLGTFKGVFFFDRDQKKIIPVELEDNQFLTGDIIYCWHQTNDSVFWLGTPSGLNKLTKKANGKFSVENYYSEMGLLDDYILGILSSNDKEIWVSTSSSIVKLNIEDQKIYTFDKSDGLPSLTFSESHGYLAGDSTMYFGTANGYFFFKSEDININEAKPPVVFTRFKIYNTEIKPNNLFNGKAFLEQSLNTNPEIHLSYKEKEFTIEFSALNYNSPQRNQYAYKMEGYDTKWVSAGDKRAVTYVNLKPGEYEFKVRGSNNNHVWNMKEISLPIKIDPAPWKTWYAFVIYVILIIGMVLLIKWNAIKQDRLVNNLEMKKIQNEQEHALHEMKLRFFTNISHEFRTPLTLILGPIKEILDENPDHNRLKIVYKNARRLMQLVNQLLEFRRIESDTLQLKVSKNNMVDFVQELCISFEELAKINHIDFKTSLEIKTKHLWFDIEKMEMVLNNLISNAFKYAGRNAAIEINFSETKDSVQIHVADNGPGIKPDEIAKIFDRFYQSADSNQQESTGIGLNLVKRMVELHKGKVEVESIANVKTEFVVTLQKGSSHFSENEKISRQEDQHEFVSKTKDSFLIKEARKEITDDKGNKKSILVVEDNREIREYLQELFEFNLNVSFAENGKTGYKKAIEQEFDLIISDILMPEMDGIEMCKMLKTNIETSHIPVILLTAKSASQYRIEGISQGAEAYISKPFDPDELKAQVFTMLSARKKVKERFGKTITLEPTDLEITSREEEFMEKVIKSIDDNIDNSEFKSEDLASALGVTSITLYRKLKSLVGMSSNEIIRSIRLKRAAQLLTDSDYTISEITYMVGFNDVKYFRKCFRKQFDQTPSTFRNNHVI